ncbi:hypothetical protein T484DRAFT_1765454 [Baffinella frigidus]|nr:hypothetical protein T484DRAFT_1765454 [Cryptophyta sp. CCMP2293]
MAIAAITPGSPAAISGELQVDDEVVAVDGMQAFEINLTKLVGGSDVVGSKCTLTLVGGSDMVGSKCTLKINLTKLVGGSDVVGSKCTLTPGLTKFCQQIRRGGRTFEVSIARTAEKRLGKIAQQQEMFAELLKIAKGTPSERLVTELTKFTAELENSRLKHEALLANKLWYQLSLLKTNSAALENSRLKHEALLANKLRRAQAHVVEQVTFAESMLSVNTGGSGARIPEMENALKAMQSERDDLMRETYRGSGARISELENALKAMQSERDDLMRENCSLQSLLNESQARMIDALAELESMKERMAGMVSKSRLDALQDDYDRMLADNTNLRDHHKGMVSKERASAAESSQQGMLEECERLRAQMRDMVARTALEGAEEDTARLRAELERLRAKLIQS